MFAPLLHLSLESPSVWPQVCPAGAHPVGEAEMLREAGAVPSSLRARQEMKNAGAGSRFAVPFNLPFWSL